MSTPPGSKLLNNFRVVLQVHTNYCHLPMDWIRIVVAYKFARSLFVNPKSSMLHLSPERTKKTNPRALWSSTSPSARHCTWVRAAPSIKAVRGMKGLWEDGGEVLADPGLQKKCGQKAKEGVSVPLLHSGETPPGVLYSALASSVQERHGLLELIQRCTVKRSQSWSTCLLRKGWESWGCSVCRKGDFGQLLWPSSTRKGLIAEMEIDFLLGPVAIAMN